MRGYIGNIEEKTLANDYYREVLFTSEHCQLVVMSLNPKEEIGLEVHEDNDQFIRVEAGEGKMILDGKEYVVGDGSAIVIPAHTEHNLINTSADKKLKLYTIYSPPHHRDKTIHKTKQDDLEDTEDHI